MTVEETIEFIRTTITEALAQEGVEANIEPGTALVGGERALDSMKLVELCLALEDRAGDLGFEFDWTSEAAMSRSRGMFRTVESLAGEFARQQGEAQ